MQTNLYAPLNKVEDQDDGTIRVYGIASTESVDAHGEVVKADAIRNAMDDYLKYPALREMHSLSAAGSTIELVVDDDDVTRIVGHVVDPTAILKVKSNVYRGFSIGGKVTKRDPKNPKIITGITLSEISLVDRPSQGDAALTMWKADATETKDDGMPEEIAGDGESEAAAIAEAEDHFAKRKFDAAERKKDAKSGAAMKDGSFPIEDAEDLKNAIRLAGKAKDPKAARAHIKARAKALGLESEIPDTWKALMSEAISAGDGEDMMEKVAAARAALIEGGADKAAVEALTPEDALAQAEAALAKVAAAAEAADDPIAKANAAVDALSAAVAAAAPTDDLSKGMYAVSRFAELLGSILYLIESGEYEAKQEGDGSKVPAKLHAWLTTGAAIFKDMAAEEVDELVAAGKVKKAAEAADLAKAAAEAADGKVAAAVADALAKAEAERDGLAKSLAERDDALIKITERIEPLVKTVEDLSKRLTDVEKQPLPPKTAGPGVAISKEADVGGPGAAVNKGSTLSDDDVRKALEAMPEEARAHILMKAAMRYPQPIGR